VQPACVLCADFLTALTDSGAYRFAAVFQRKAVIRFATNLAFIEWRRIAFLNPYPAVYALHGFVPDSLLLILLIHPKHEFNVPFGTVIIFRVVIVDMYAVNALKQVLLVLAVLAPLLLTHNLLPSNKAF
jgi:hypothetical protein